MTHIDGILQVTGGACGSCHGDETLPGPLGWAPPMDLAGNPASDKVGAHRAHLQPQIGAEVQCNACHVVPVTVGQPGHIDVGDDIAEVTFGDVAVASGATPTFAPASLTCTNNYCHGITTEGGTNGNQVSWTADATQSDCGACHGLPPNTIGHQMVAPTDPCGSCHDISASTTDQTITVPQFHVDGTMQVSGCGGACHDVPPTTGAHDRHAGILGFECAACHGNNGSGPTHNEGSDVVDLANVNLVFDATIAFSAGTTIGNGGSPSFNSGTKVCQVGCHNPVIGDPPETPNLNQQPVWAEGVLDCTACHDRVGARLPLNHDLTGQERSGCLECHDLTRHTRGTIDLVDPDPSDSFTPRLGDPSPQCKTCHDSPTPTFFGGQAPPDVMLGWNASAHGQEGFQCSECHTHHVSLDNPDAVFVERTSANCLEGGCHSEMAEPGGPFTFANSHHMIEQPGSQLTCINCHNPHLSRSPPLAAINPDNKWELFDLPSSAATERRGTSNNFCLSCHDGNEPPGVSGALNIAQALQGGNDPSDFKKENESLHRKDHDDFNCVSCHDWHGNEGPGGINRGRMLLPYMDITEFPYREKKSCGTPKRDTGNLGRVWNGQWVSFSFGCH